MIDGLTSIGSIIFNSDGSIFGVGTGSLINFYSTGISGSSSSSSRFRNL